jgi:site-specific DNA-methyltransferase (adenine-specific)
MDLNTVYNENCLDTMSRMDDNSIDLTVTSPPYDDLRTYKYHIKGNHTDYNGYSFPFEEIAKELYRVTK